MAGGYSDPSQDLAADERSGAAGRPRLSPVVVWVCLLGLLVLAGLSSLMLTQVRDEDAAWSAPPDPESGSIRAPRAVHAPPDADRTRAYLANLDVKRFERGGTDYGHPRYAAAPLGGRLDDILVPITYDLARLQAAHEELAGVDRRLVLRRIFEQVTEGLATELEKHRAVLGFLHRSGFHNTWYPQYADGVMVKDPLVVLTLNEMWCGTVSRLAVDLFEAAGYRARLVQLAGHVVAEVHYEGDWHYLDGDIFGNGESIVDRDGSIPSVEELSRRPYAIDALAHYREPVYPGKARTTSITYPSYAYFSERAYAENDVVPAYYEKTADDRQRLDPYYGWHVFRTRRDAPWILHDIQPASQPGAVTFTRVDRRDGDEGPVVDLAWSDARDRDGDLLGYQVFVSRSSRGWGYSEPAEAGPLRTLLSHPEGWRPDMYAKLFELPPHETRFERTRAPAVTLRLEPGAVYYVTVMPYDRHGEAVGKRLYHMSSELRLDLRSPALSPPARSGRRAVREAVTRPARQS